jgi:hypothetical protein
MTAPAYFAQPPRIATWLLNLFTPGGEAESILGDLLEEYSHLASKSGIAFARHWYWRQTAKTIPHLAARGFRVAPWSTAVAVIGGFLLNRLVSGMSEQAIFAALHRYHIFDRHFSAYVFFATDGVAIGHVIASMLVGCAVALAAKGDADYGNASSHPLRDDWRCWFGMGVHWAGLHSLDAALVRN